MARMKGQKWNSNATDDDLLARLMPGGDHHHLIEPGGSWLRHTEMAIARRDGDHETLARLEAEQVAVMTALAQGVRAAFAKKD